MAAQAPPRVSRNVSLPAGRQPSVGALARRTLSESDLEPGAANVPSGSSSSSSLSSRSNESNTVAADQQASQSDWSEEEDPLAAQWSDSLPQHIRDSIVLSARIRKRQEVIHELIVSEGSHVRWLKVLGVDFLKPLERQPSLLPAEELRALFPNLPSVRDRHTKLYAELRAVRSEAVNHVVQIRPVADAMLNTALKKKVFHGYASSDIYRSIGEVFFCLRTITTTFLARLTKYQLLLESILKTVAEDLCENEESESVDDVAQLKKALTVAKEVLHSVDTAIRTAENEHR
ncbi:jg10454 [Pararge aegeria aegeria]|uniref:Jg10454 protein n=1 Tax=Pararge aegeria aegeria TaxID=348720 RepID=A0A8S4REI7_9NEOP|nr:jg10454 [Pararge aegeria aegeria]